MSELPVTSILAAILGLMALPLSIHISARRAAIGMKAGVIHAAVFGDANDPMLRNAIRAFGNFVEYVPLALIMLALYELNGASTQVLWGLGGAFVIGRFLHAISMTFIPTNPAPRGIAMLTTYAVIGWPAIAMLLSL